MQRHIDILRSKPEHVRKQIAFGGSLMITFFIFMFWLSSSGVFGTASGVAGDGQATTTSTSAGPLTASVITAWDGIASLTGDISKLFSHHTYTAPPDGLEVIPTSIPAEIPTQAASDISGNTTTHN